MKVIDKVSLIGKRIAKLDAPEKASGMTRYVHDLDVPGQLHARILRSAVCMPASDPSTPPGRVRCPACTRC